MEDGIDCCYELYEKTNSKTYFEQSLLFSESDKAMVLLEALYDSRFKKEAFVPDSLIQKEKTFRKRVLALKNDLRQMEEDEAYTDHLAVKKDSLFTLDQQLESFINQLESDYPDYKQLKGLSEGLNLSQVQKSLDTNSAILESFEGIKAHYFFLHK